MEQLSASSQNRNENTDSITRMLWYDICTREGERQVIVGQMHKSMCDNTIYLWSIQIWKWYVKEYMYRHTEVILRNSDRGGCVYETFWMIYDINIDSMLQPTKS